MPHVHQHDDWPSFRWSDEALSARLGTVRHRQGRWIGHMSALGFALRSEAVLATLTEDVLKSSEIEGEHLDKDQVRSSIARRLGMDIAGMIPADRHVEGVVEMMLDATQNYAAPLTADRLFNWHAAMFPTGRSGMSAITVGAWRKDESGPMQVASGPIGRDRIHYEAPAAASLEQEMQTFIDWFEADTKIDPVIKAGIAHLWFVTIHPFDGGNGRMARAIADLALARSEETAQRFYSMSTQIRADRDAYYDLLEKTQKGDLDVTPWLAWFLDCLERAIDGAEVTLSAVLDKARFWDRHAETPINDRQRLMINRLFGPFEGQLNTSKWAKMAKTSNDTALRDIQDLVDKGMLARDEGGGRSTSYRLVRERAR